MTAPYEYYPYDLINKLSIKMKKMFIKMKKKQ